MDFSTLPAAKIIYQKYNVMINVSMVTALHPSMLHTFPLLPQLLKISDKIIILEIRKETMFNVFYNNIQNPIVKKIIIVIFSNENSDEINFAVCLHIALGTYKKYHSNQFQVHYWSNCIFIFVMSFSSTRLYFVYQISTTLNYMFITQSNFRNIIYNISRISRGLIINIII